MKSVSFSVEGVEAALSSWRLIADLGSIDTAFDFGGVEELTKSQLPAVLQGRSRRLPEGRGKMLRAAVAMTLLLTASSIVRKVKAISSLNVCSSSLFSLLSSFSTLRLTVFVSTYVQGIASWSFAALHMQMRTPIAVSLDAMKDPIFEANALSSS